jgi:putative acetyltransferase
MSVAIAIETPLSDDVRALVAALNETALKLTPREFTHHLTVEHRQQFRRRAASLSQGGL